MSPDINIIAAWCTIFCTIDIVISKMVKIIFFVHRMHKIDDHIIGLNYTGSVNVDMLHKRISENMEFRRNTERRMSKK